MQCLQRFGRGRLHRVGHGQQPGEPAVDGQVHDAGALAALRFGALCQRRNVDAQLRHQRRVAQRQLASADDTAHADARFRIEILRLVQRQLLLARCGDDRRRQRVFTDLVQAGGQTQHLAVFKAAVTERALEGRPALGQRAGLVDDQSVDLA